MHDIVVYIIDGYLLPFPLLQVVLVDFIGHLIAFQLVRRERLDSGFRNDVWGG